MCAIACAVIAVDLRVHMCMCIRYDVWAFVCMGAKCVCRCRGTSRLMPSDIAKKVPGSAIIVWPFSISKVIICAPCVVRDHVRGWVRACGVFACISCTFPLLFGCRKGRWACTQPEEGREACKPTWNILTCMSSPRISYFPYKRTRMHACDFMVFFGQSSRIRCGASWNKT